MNIIFNKHKYTISSAILIIILIFTIVIGNCIGTTVSSETESVSEEPPIETTTVEEEFHIIKEIEVRYQYITVIPDDYDFYKNEYIKAQAETAPETVLPEEGSEYPVATHVWNFLQAAGYNDYVCAGIIGNMMVECGGFTLNLQWDIYNPSHNSYGLCQWLSCYYGEIHGASLDEQLQFLVASMPYEFEIFGSSYQSGFTYETFLNLTDCSEAAVAFAKIYERCGSQSTQSRIEGAIAAYNYFHG